MSDPYEFVPPFVSPLTHDQHARLGRIAILWGQIDMIVDQLLQAGLGITGEQRIALIGEKPIGGKLDMLSGAIKNIEPGEAQAPVREFWRLANETKTIRNRCFHGVWGFRCGRKQGEIFAAAAHFKEQENPVRVTQLPALEKKLCKTARIGMEALSLVLGFDRKKGCNRLFHGAGDTFMATRMARTTSAG